MLSIKRRDTVGEFFRSRVHVRFEPSSGAAESRPALRGNGDHLSPPSHGIRQQMTRARARAIMESKCCVLPDGAGGARGGAEGSTLFPQQYRRNPDIVSF